MSNRVLVVGEYGTLNGGENSFLAVAPEMIDRGWNFKAAIPVDSQFSNSLQALGCQTHNLCWTAFDGQRKTQPEIRADIAEIIGIVKPDLIHCNSLSTSRMCGPVAKDLGLPSLGYVRDILKLSKKAISDINQLDRIIAVSNATRNWHCEQGLEAHKTFVVYNGVDTDVFSPDVTANSSTDPDTVKTELGISPHAPVILFVGQIGIRKGVDTLVDGFLAAAKSVSNMHLLIVGQRHSQKHEAIEYEQRLRKQTNPAICQQNIDWLGVRSDVPTLMRASTILVHPARQEPLGRVLLESAASGLPIITTRVGGSPEILHDRAFEELMIETNDPIELGSKIVSLIEQPHHLNKLGLMLRDMVKQRFTSENCARQLDHHYRQLVDK